VAVICHWVDITLIGESGKVSGLVVVVEVVVVEMVVV
jgi:hypothetical protein